MSLAARGGWQTATIYSAVDAEVQAIRPGFALVMAGTNDIGPTPEPVYRQQLTALVNQLLIRGVIPILSTIPTVLINGDEGVRRTYLFNQTIAEVAAERHVPLMNYWAAMQEQPGLGISHDLVHPSEAGYAVRSYVALRALSTLRQDLGLA